MIIPIRNIDTGAIFYFTAATAYEAMDKLKYYLRVKDDTEKLVINKSPLNNFLYVIYKGEIYCAKMEN